MLAQDLHADRALAGDHVGVVVGVNEGQALVGLELARLGVGFVEGVAVQNDVAAAASTASTLMAGVVRGMTMIAGMPSFCGRERHPLRVVAGGGADHAALQRLGGRPAILL